MPKRRFLKFTQMTDPLEEAHRLAGAGYEQCGNWNLGQVCHHLTAAYNASIDGYQSKTPWVLQNVIGPVAKYGFLYVGRFPAGAPGPPQIMPGAIDDENAAIAALAQAVERVRNHQGAFDRHPIFGVMTPAQNRRLHLIHAAHHLGFLQPKQ